MQENFITNVEDDAATRDELAHYKEKLGAFRSQVNNQHQSSEASLLASQLEEVSNSIESASQTFEQYNQINTQRTEVFANFRADANAEVLKNFSTLLYQHLS